MGLTIKGSGIHKLKLIIIGANYYQKKIKSLQQQK